MRGHEGRSGITRRTALTATALAALATGTAPSRATASEVRTTGGHRVTTTQLTGGAAEYPSVFELLGVNRRGQVLAMVNFERLRTAPAVWTDGLFTEPELPAPGSIYLRGLNDRGQLAGFHRDADRRGRAVLWTRGVPEFLDTGHVEETGEFLNNRGEVVIRASERRFGPWKTLVYRRGRVTEVLPPDGWPGSAGALQFNDRGQLVARAYSSGSEVWGLFLWDDGTTTEIVPPGADTSGSLQTVALNVRGQVVGNRYWTPDGIDSVWFWDGGEVLDLGTGERNFYVDAAGQAMNDRGEIVGYSTRLEPPVSPLPVLWSAGRMRVLEAPGSGLGTARAINNRSEIAGSFRIPEGADSACLWRDGRAIDLGIPEGFESSRALLITERGEVFGMAGAWGRQPQAFRWTVD